MEGRSLDGIVAACDRPTLRALLVAGASGYSGTLVPRILPQFTGPTLRSQLLTRGEARAGLRLVPIEQVVESNRQCLHVTIGDGDNVTANDGSAYRHG